MPGRAAMNSTSGALADIRATKMSSHDSGISGSDTSEIGGEARKGASGEGGLSNPNWKNVTSMMNGSGMAKTGETGQSSGSGKTL